MSSIARYAIVLAVSLSCALCSSVANSQTKTPKKPAPNSVSGRVTVHGKGAPGIVVGMRSSDFSPEGAPARKGTTDHDGNYQITDIPAGNYQIAPMAPAHSNPDLILARERGKMLLLGEGEDVQGINFSLVRGAVITGKISDADGRPVIDERLTIVREDQARQNGRGLPPVPGGFQTDDRGIYRVYGLPAGRYKISVGVAEEDLYSSIRFGRVAYKRTFHPDATNPTDARVVEVPEGAEATNIDITVGRNLPRFVVSGTVVDGETNKPVMGLRLGLRRMIDDREGSFVQGIFAASNGQGEFRLETVTPGKYGVFVGPQPGSEVRTDAVFVEVIDQDVTGLLLKTIKGLSLTGRVVLEGTYDRSVIAKLAQLRLRAYVREISASGQESPIDADGSFRIGGLAAGVVNFWLIAQGGRPPVSFAIVRVERDGIVQRRGVELKAGEHISGVKIVVSYGTGSIRGEVKVENGPLPAGGRATVWIKRVGATESKIEPHNLDSRGHFLIEGVAAGDYEINVNANMPGRPPPASAKQSISVTEGAITDVVMILDLKANPGPNP